MMEVLSWAAQWLFVVLGSIALYLVGIWIGCRVYGVKFHDNWKWW